MSQHGTDMGIVFNQRGYRVACVQILSLWYLLLLIKKKEICRVMLLLHSLFHNTRIQVL